MRDRMVQVSTLVCFHAHPDDEVFGTGGVMRLAADAGHRVVLVVATDGALGECPPGILVDGQTLAQRRRDELHESATVLGADRIVMLDYPDSGMVGSPGNDDPSAFMNVDVEDVAQKVAQILVDEDAAAFTIYDPFGNYGHPDHIQVHRAGLRAAEIAATPAVYMSTMDRDHMKRLVELNPHWSDQDMPIDIEQLGTPGSEITTEVDVRAVLPAKRAAMWAHATQVGDFGEFRDMPIEQLEVAFGSECFVRVGADVGPERETHLAL